MMKHFIIILLLISNFGSFFSNNMAVLSYHCITTSIQWLKTISVITQFAYGVLIGHSWPFFL